MATNDFHYIRKEDAGAQNIRLCISTTGQTLDNQNFKFPNEEFYCKSTAEMTALFADAGSDREYRADRDTLPSGIPFRGVNYLPAFTVPAGRRQVCTCAVSAKKRCRQRYRVVSAAVRERLEYELGIIEKHGLCDYFLIVMDFIRYARSQDIAVSRGAARRRARLWRTCSALPNLDPLAFGLLFERFLNPERISMPDIDTDIDYKGRGEVIAYLAQVRRGTCRADHHFRTMAARAVVRDVGRVMNLPYGDVDRIARMILGVSGITLADTLAKIPNFAKNMRTTPRCVSWWTMRWP